MLKRLPNWKKFSLGIILLISFAPYVGVLANFYSTNLRFSIPRKVFFSSDCTSLAESVCDKALLFERPNLNRGDFVLFGAPSTVPRFKCLGEEKVEKIFASLAVGPNQIFSSDIPSCEKGILVYYRRDIDSASSSWILPLMVYGNKNALMRISQSINFFRLELRSVISVAVPFQVLLLFFLLALLGGKAVGAYLFSFITVSLMAFFNGEIFEKVFFLGSGFLRPEFKELLALLILGTYFLETTRRKIGYRDFFILIFAASAVEFLFSYFQVSKEAIWIGVVSLWGVVAAVDRFSFVSTSFFILNCFYLVSVLTPFNFIPQYAGTLFFTVYFIGFQVEQVRLRLISWRFNQLSRGIVDEVGVTALLKIIAKVNSFGAVGMSLIKNNEFRHMLLTKKRQRPNYQLGNEVSAIVAKVYATGKPLWNIPIDSELGRTLISSESKNVGRKFSAIPIDIGGVTWGVLSFGDYDRSFSHPDTFSSVTDVFIECSEVIGKSLGQVTNKLASDLSELFSKYSEFDDTLEIEEVVVNFLNSAYELHAISGYFAKVKEDGLIELLVSTGELDGRLDAINKSSFKVNPSNEFGPIAIAFRECEPVVLQNWRLIAEKISKPAQNVYTETNANSIVTIPIHLNVGRNLFRYVLWMQTNETRVFGKDFLKSARFIQNKINHILTAKVSRVASDTMLSLADSEVIQNAMHGASSYIREVGELLMVDLTKSTILSGILSYEDYEQLLSKYTEVLSDALCQLGYRLHMAKGDALLFTKNEVSGFVPRTVLFKMIASCDILLKGFVRKLVENDVYAYEPSFRLCSVTGDISRDLVKGARGGWAIVGSSINEVHKLESVAKLHREGIYFEFSIKAPEPGVDFISSEFSAWEGSPPIRYVKFASLEDKLAA